MSSMALSICGHCGSESVYRDGEGDLVCLTCGWRGYARTPKRKADSTPLSPVTHKYGLRVRQPTSGQER